MYRRQLNLLKKHSFFLFGARGTGKTQLLRENFLNEASLWIDLLKDQDFLVYSRNPDRLYEQTIAIVENNPNKIHWIIIDEVQKVSKLLDVVHRVLEEPKVSKKVFFALTGSSSRKLKRGGANLLAGRAINFYLFPLTFIELEKDFNLNTILNWGSLPLVIAGVDQTIRAEVLESYVANYLREEIKEEQIVRNIDPFTRFLEVAAQSSGDIVNYASIASDCQVDAKAVARYYQILEDTLLGFFLPSYHKSIRKQQTQSPRFYLFDLGVKQALQGTLDVPISEQTSSYGNIFEQFIILEIYRLNTYLKTRYKLYYLRTKDNAEIDLIVERPGEKTILIEIKSASNIADKHLTHLESFIADFKNSEAWVLSRETIERKKGDIHILPWQIGIKRLFKLL